MTTPKDTPIIIPPHGGCRELRSYQMAEIVHDARAVFCDRFIDKRSRTHDQMVQAARSCKQKIAEGSRPSGTSKKTGINRVGVAHASLEELLIDFQDFLRQRGLPLWGKEHLRGPVIRAKAFEKKSEIAVNTVISLINQASYLFGQQLRVLEQEFVNDGGFTERRCRGSQAREKS